MLWFEPRGSVLDKYDQPLKARLPAQFLSTNCCAAMTRCASRLTSFQKLAPVLPTSRRKKNPYKTEQTLRQAIVDWEEKVKGNPRNKAFTVWSRRCCPLMGLLAYKKLNRWLGITLLIAAFAEFIYWTSPTFYRANSENLIACWRTSWRCRLFRWCS